MKKVTKVLNRKGVTVLYDLYENNGKFSEDLANYIRNKLAKKSEQMLDKNVTTLLLKTFGFE